MIPPVEGIVIDGGWHLKYATVVQFNVGDDVFVSDWYRDPFDNVSWYRDHETGVYLSYEAFDRLVEAVREQRTKEAEAVKENP